MLSLKRFFAFLPSERLETLACRHQVDADHSVKLSGPRLFLCLLNGRRNHPQLRQRLLEETYFQQTGNTRDHSTFGQCLSKVPVGYVADLFTALHQKMEPPITLGTRNALKLRFVDAPRVTLSAKLLTWGLLASNRTPAKTRRQIKSILELSEAGVPNLLRVGEDKSESADRVALGVTLKAQSHPNDLWGFDKGGHGRDRLLALHENQAFWLTPLSQQQVCVQQTLFVLPEEPHPCGVPWPSEATWVRVRVAQVVFQNSETTPKTQAKWAGMPLLLGHGLRVDVRTQTWKELIWMTNLPLSADKEHAGAFTWDELALVYGQRWAIEVFFKFLKQNLNESHLTSWCENGIKGMIYMSLIAALLLIWYKQQTGIDRGWRSVKFWLADAVRRWTQELLQTVHWGDDD